MRKISKISTRDSEKLNVHTPSWKRSVTVAIAASALAMQAQAAWELVSSEADGIDTLDTYIVHQWWDIQPITYTRKWSEGHWVGPQGSLWPGFQFAYPHSNPAPPREISMTSEGTTTYRFKYTPTQGEPIPKRAVFRVSSSVEVVSSGIRSGDNGFGDSLHPGENPGGFFASGTHLIERAVSSDGTVVITLPKRKASAQASGQNSYVWADAFSSNVTPETRRAEILWLNFQAIPNGQSEYLLSSRHGQPPERMEYPSYIRVSTPVEDSGAMFNQATFLVGAPTTLVKMTDGYSVPDPPPPVSLTLGATATLLPGSVPHDTYTWSPGTSSTRTSAAIDSWQFSDHYYRESDVALYKFTRQYLINEVLYGFEKLSGPQGPYRVTFKYRWHDGVTATSQRNLIYGPAAEKVFSRPINDSAQEWGALPLADQWIEGTRFKYDAQSMEALLAGANTMSVFGAATSVVPTVGTGLGLFFTAIGMGLESVAMDAESGKVEIFPDDTDGRLLKKPGFPAVGPAKWWDFELGADENSSWRSYKRSFVWKVWYLPKDKCTVEVFNRYGDIGFLGQQVAVQRVEHPKHLCEFRYQYFHESAPGRP